MIVLELIFVVDIITLPHKFNFEKFYCIGKSGKWQLFLLFNRKKNGSATVIFYA